ncbi:nuclear transport factor 2 family protein [Sphingosinicella sp. CPCC 101087]|uniref:nuclear transport factor 2 family protein n=1 Tax=Sphingosinicella sp. CPCC 101087 TaxID=2497754 RepID=UPI0013ED85F9|nr:nuclear transport factor 2 family protein [Sphingosinicella sp. CPCC 101087]
MAAVSLATVSSAAAPLQGPGECTHPEAAPEQVVRKLLDAGNRSDLETWLCLFHPDARQFRRSEDPHRLADRPSATVTDAASRRRVYEEIFSRPDKTRAEILGMLSLGELVVSRGVFHAPTGPIQTLTIYRVHDGRILDIWDVEQQRD